MANDADRNGNDTSNETYIWCSGAECRVSRARRGRILIKTRIDVVS